MNSGHRRTLARIFAQPIAADIRWSEIEALFTALGGEVSEGAGSRVRVALGGCRAVFQRPHPNPDARRSSVRAVKAFLVSAGIRNEER